MPSVPLVGLCCTVMGNNKAGRGTLSGVVDQAIIDLIDKRRARVNLSRSTYLSLIVQGWVAGGCLPVTPAEKAIEELEKIKLPPSDKR